MMLFLRKYRLTIETWRGDTITFDNSELRLTFHIEKNITRIYQLGEITLYNLNPDTETDIFKNGKSLTLEAGYQDGPYGVIFRGAIRQPIRGKEDETTYFLKLVCFDGDEILHLGFCNLVLTSGQTAQAIINQIARSSSVPFDIRVDDNLSKQITQRGKTIFGQVSDHIRSVTINSNATFYFDNGVGYVTPLSKQPPAIVPTLNAQTGMVGMPHQTDQGIEVRCLINPDIHLDNWVKLNNRNIIQAQVEFGVPQTLLDLDGLYRVISIEATGDTRGNDWYYDINGYSQTGILPQMLVDPSQTGL